jgi:hypothetical protein
MIQRATLNGPRDKEAADSELPTLLRVELPGMPGFYFSDSGAWDVIADRLEAGVEFEVITLKTPAGASAIWFEVQLHTGRPPVYVKVQLGYSNKAIGRSFHHSHSSKERK